MRRVVGGAAADSVAARVAAFDDAVAKHLADVRTRVPDFTAATLADPAVPLDEAAKEAVRGVLNKFKYLEELMKAGDTLPDGARMTDEQTELLRAFVKRQKAVKEAAEEGGGSAGVAARIAKRVERPAPVEVPPITLPYPSYVDAVKKFQAGEPVDSTMAEAFATTVRRLRAMNTNGLRPQAAQSKPYSVNFGGDFERGSGALNWNDMAVEDLGTNMADVELKLLDAYEKSALKQVVKATIRGGGDDAGSEAARAMVAVEKQLSEAEDLAGKLQKAAASQADFEAQLAARQALLDAQLKEKDEHPIRAAVKFLTSQDARDAVKFRETGEDPVLDSLAKSAADARARRGALQELSDRTDAGDLKGIRAARFGERLLELRQSRDAAERAWKARDEALAELGRQSKKGKRVDFSRDGELVEQFYRFKLADEKIKMLEAAGPEGAWAKGVKMIQDNIVVDARAAFQQSRPFTHYGKAVPDDEVVYFGRKYGYRNNLVEPHGPVFDPDPVQQRIVEFAFDPSPQGTSSFSTRAQKQRAAEMEAWEKQRKIDLEADEAASKRWKEESEKTRWRAEEAERRRRQAAQELRDEQDRMAQAVHESNDPEKQFRGRGALADSHAAKARVDRADSLDGTMLAVEAVGNGRYVGLRGAAGRGEDVVTSAGGTGGKNGNYGVRTGADAAEGLAKADEGEGHLVGIAAGDTMLGAFVNDKGTRFNGIATGNEFVGTIRTKDGTVRTGVFNRHRVVGQQISPNGDVFNGVSGNTGVGTGQHYSRATGQVENGVGVPQPVNYAMDTSDEIMDAITSSRVNVDGIVTDLRGRRTTWFGGE